MTAVSDPSLVCQTLRGPGNQRRHLVAREQYAGDQSVGSRMSAGAHAPPHQSWCAIRFTLFNAESTPVIWPVAHWPCLVSGAR